MLDIIKPESRHIVYDLDDVLANFWGTALPLMNREFGTNLKKTDFTDYNSFVDNMGITKGDFLQFVVERVPMDELEPNKLFINLLNAQYAQGHVISIITSRDYIKYADSLTRRWLSKNNVNFHNLYISGAIKKSEFLDTGADIAYDDHHANLDDYLDSGKIKYGVLVDQPWNRGYNRKNVIRKSMNEKEGVFNYDE